MADQFKLPLAEHFHSIQGEGTWVGSAMHFIRTAGCTVGKRNQPNKFTPKLPSGKFAWKCGAYDGREFYCDTDFTKYLERTPQELYAETWEQRVCLTGGEPLMHMDRLTESGFFTTFSDKMIHLETSGTIVIPQSLRGHFYWITVAPKVGWKSEMLAIANEIRLLVDDKFSPDTFPEDVKWQRNIFLCPVNGVDHVIQRNIELCMGWLEKFPGWRMSCQLHKLLGLR